MKKNKFLRLASFMLIACLATCCAVGGTFAKYTASGSAGDTARVAKWGVTITATDDGEANKTVLDTYDGNDEAQISVVQDLKLMAPGTKGGLISVNVEGKPEVAVNVAVSFTLTLTGWNIGTSAEEYMPLVFTAVIAGTTNTYKIGSDSGEYADIAALKDAIEQDIKAVNGDYAPDKDFSDILDLKLSWSWAFETGANADEIAANDKKDTALGDAAAAGNAPTMTVSYSIVMNQID